MQKFPNVTTDPCFTNQPLTPFCRTCLGEAHFFFPGSSWGLFVPNDLQISLVMRSRKKEREREKQQQQPCVRIGLTWAAWNGRIISQFPHHWFPFQQLRVLLDFPPQNFSAKHHVLVQLWHLFQPFLHSRVFSPSCLCHVSSRCSLCGESRNWQWPLVSGF